MAEQNVRILLIFIIVNCAFYGCQMKDKIEDVVEKQLTSGSYGHFLNPFQAFSPDDQWLVYDTRNEDPLIGQTARIERVNTGIARTDTIYTTSNPSEYGPGVGAAAYSPVRDQVIFIHGIENADRTRPYGITRRSGVGLYPDRPDEIIHYDARDILDPYTMGALRGGSHAHSWSGDGQWISFTYNDDVIARLSTTNPGVVDLRNIGVMAPWGGVEVKKDREGENLDGTMFSMVVARITDRPRNGSDEISKAYEEGWIGVDGYTDESGNHHPRSVAFLGDVRGSDGTLITEVFVVDLPESKPDLSDEQQMKGDSASRPEPLSGLIQRRVTFTTGRKYPGVQGPRQWMKSSPDGSILYFMMKDDRGVVQLYSVPTNGGEPRQITANDFDIETSLDISPDGAKAAYGSAEKIYSTNLQSGRTDCLTPAVPEKSFGLRAIQWSHSGNMLAYNRKVPGEGGAFFQIFTLMIPPHD